MVDLNDYLDPEIPLSQARDLIAGETREDFEGWLHSNLTKAFLLTLASEYLEVVIETQNGAYVGEGDFTLALQYPAKMLGVTETLIRIIENSSTFYNDLAESYEDDAGEEVTPHEGY